MLPHLDAAYTLARYLLRDEQAAPGRRAGVVPPRASPLFGIPRRERARAWLLTIVRHCCATARTRRRREVEFVEFDERQHSRHIEPATPELHLVRSDASDTFRRAILRSRPTTGRCSSSAKSRTFHMKRSLCCYWRADRNGDEAASRARANACRP